MLLRVLHLCRRNLHPCGIYLPRMLLALVFWNPGVTVSCLWLAFFPLQGGVRGVTLFSTLCLWLFSSGWSDAPASLFATTFISWEENLWRTDMSFVTLCFVKACILALLVVFLHSAETLDCRCEHFLNHKRFGVSILYSAGRESRCYLRRLVWHGSALESRLSFSSYTAYSGTSFCSGAAPLCPSTSELSFCLGVPLIFGCMLSSRRDF